MGFPIRFGGARSCEMDDEDHKEEKGMRGRRVEAFASAFACAVPLWRLRPSATRRRRVNLEPRTAST